MIFARQAGPGSGVTLLTKPAPKNLPGSVRLSGQDCFVGRSQRSLTPDGRSGQTRFIACLVNNN